MKLNNALFARVNEERHILHERDALTLDNIEDSTRTVTSLEFAQLLLGENIHGMPFLQHLAISTDNEQMGDAIGL